MELKSKVLEDLINDSIRDIKDEGHDNESFCIYDKDGVQVQIIVTQDEYEMMDEVIPTYVNAL